MHVNDAGSLMTEEENLLLTRTGPGTPCGELMRRYWQPAALSEELPAGGAPLPVRLLGEDLVLFRDDAGRPGLLGLHCSHRGADLSYGRVEDGGLRCIYHGWLYDTEGRCLDQPGEPGGGQSKNSIRHPAYPCHEQAGVIFAYLGLGEPPLFPGYEFLSAPDKRVFAMKLFHECNYLQGNEGNIDLIHLSFLHYNYKNRGIGAGLGSQGEDPESFKSGKLGGRGAAPEVESTDAELTDYGLRSYKIRRNAGPDRYHLYVTEFVLPNFTAFPGSGYDLGGYSVNWHVPVDDACHWKYTFILSRSGPVDKNRLRRSRSEVTSDYRPVRNRNNRYLQDRGSMERESYSGIGLNFQDQDLSALEGMGRVLDRAKEHLVPADRAVVAARKVLLNAIREVQEGRDPANVARDPKSNRFRIVAAAEFVPAAKDWKAHARDLEEKIERE